MKTQIRNAIILSTLLATAAATSRLLAAEASISGPTEFTTGQLAVLDGGKSSGDKLQWVIPPQFKSLPSKTMKLGLTCDVPGRYVIMLIAVDKDLEIAVATHELTITNGED